MNHCKFAILLLGVLCCAGCTQFRLPAGKYMTSLPDREDMACVYGDYIYIRLKTPEDTPDADAYWQWAGKYKVKDDGRIVLEMDHETDRIWRFYFNFLYSRRGIVVNDLAKSSGFMLRLIPVAKRPGKSAPQPANAPPEPQLQ